MVGTAERTLALKLIADVAGLNKGLRQTETRMQSFTRSATSWTKAFTGALVIDGIERVGSALGDAWAGFRSGQQVAAQLQVTWKNLDIKGASFAKTLETVATSASHLGMSDDEAVAAFNHLLQATGSVHESMKRLRIAQDLVANGSAPNLEAALKIIQGASKGTAKVVDKFGLTAKTAGGRVGQLGRHMHNAAKRKAELDPLGTLFTVMSDDLENIVGSLATGNIPGAIEAIAASGNDLADAWERARTTNQGFLGSGTLIDDTLNTISDAFDRLNPLIGAATGVVFGLQKAIGEVLGPVMQQVHDGPLADIIAAIGGVAVGSLNFSLQAATLLIQEVGDALSGDFGKAVSDAGAGLKAMADTVHDAFRTVVGAIGEMMGGIVTAWNDLDFNIPAGSFQFTPAQHIPNPFGGFFDIPAVGFSWPGTGDLIPDLAQGGIVRARSGGTLARLGEGGRDEAVVPLGAGGGMGATYNVTVNNYGSSDVALGQTVVHAIQQYEKRAGAAWRR